MARPSGRPTSATNSMTSLRSGGSVIVAPKLRDFVFTEKLGSGTYATVYKAYRKGGLREVAAIKCVQKSSLNKSSTENLLTEIEILKKLKHENIVELKDFQWDDTYIYLIMEYCSGGDLSHFIRSKRMLPEQIVRRFLRHIVSAMKFLRAYEVAHMDLKPQNILIKSSSDPVIKIADFGFAKHLFQGDELHALRGSPLYMAPEIICKGQYDARVDLWSVGVILYECLFGRAPYASKSFKELEGKIWDPKPIELPYSVPVSDNCQDLLLQLLQRNPNDRISFDDFFVHPFLDLKHMPSSESLPEAVRWLASRTRALTALLHNLPVILTHLEDVASRKSSDEPAKAKGYLKEMTTVKFIMMLHAMVDILSIMSSLSKVFQKSDLLVTDVYDHVEVHVVRLEELKQEPGRKLKTRLVQQAVTQDEKGDYPEAVKLYCEAVEFFLPAIKYEKSESKKNVLRKRVQSYMDRAQELKNMLKPHVLKHDPTLERSQSTDSRQELLELFKDSEQTAAALKLVEAAIVEEENEDFDHALQHYEMALGAVIETIKSESKGRRKDLLKEQASYWMTKAEEIKSYLEVKKLDTSKRSETEELEEESENSILGSGQCSIQ